jgi:hypothetical protein
MTFLNPVVLLGLAAAAIPLILHLLNLRKLRTIEFSSLRFLKELQQTKIRRLKLRQIILLIIRTLIIVFIVLTFARPTLHGTFFGSGSQAHSTMVIILDNTFSMSAADNHGERFKQAKDAAIRITEMLKEGDEAYFIRLSEIPHATIGPATHDIESLKKIINESATSAIRRSIGDALRTSAKLLEHSSNANKEIYIITDRQQTELALPTRGAESLRLFSAQTHLYLVPIGSDAVPNTSIDSLSIVSTILEKDKPISLFVSVRNWSPNPLINYVLSTYISGKKSAQNSINVEPWATGSLEITATAQQTGLLRGYVELEDDAIEIDNRRYFVLSIPEETKVAILAGSALDSRFIHSALEARSGEQGSVITIEDITQSKLQYIDFNSMDVVISVNITSFNSGICTRLKEYVSQGGGLIIFPGPNIDINNYNRELLAKLEIPPIEKIIGTNAQPSNLVFQSFDFDHPLFSNIFEKQQPGMTSGGAGVESPNITTALVRKVDKKSRSIISMSDGSPALSEHGLGGGRILLFSISPSLDWSDFPIKGIFAPLIYRSVIYASPREDMNTSIIVGDEIMLPIIARKEQRAENRQVQSAPYKLTAPDSVEEIIRQVAPEAIGDKTGRLMFLPIRSLPQPGIYEIRKGGQLISLIAANTYPPESDPRIAEKEELIGFAEYHGIQSSNVHTTAIGEDLQPSILQFRFGVELWRYCVIIAIILALIEIIIARDSRSSFAEKSVQ